MGKLKSQAEINKSQQTVCGISFCSEINVGNKNRVNFAYIFSTSISLKD